MNQRLPYEKQIADKLQKLHLPDPEMTWQQMRVTLDHEMPLSGKDKLRGVRKWWIAGSIIVIFSVGIWLAAHNTTDSNKLMSQEEGAKQASLVSEPVTANEFSAPGLQNNNEHTINLGVKSKSEGVVSNSTHLNEEASAVRTGETNADSRIEQFTSVRTTRDDLDEGMVRANEIARVKESNGYDNTVINHDHTSFTRYTEISKVYRISNTDSGQSDYSTRESIIEGKRVLMISGTQIAIPKVKSDTKSIMREMKRQERREEKDLARSYRTYRSFWGENSDRWFAAGVAPYQNIAVANQQGYHYNSSAGKNLISDYLPSPYLQFHVTNRVYLQSEFQFNAPQSTPSLLLSQRTLSAPSGNIGFTENIYLRKLYYFNMPVSFYYSPVKNFYIGSGLQFSSFNSGLANIEQRTSNNTLLHSTIIKLKDDSLSAKINGSEWRYLFDANYYQDRFVLGVRYNQALNHFIDFRMNGGVPPTQARNQSFQFYIRYNLVVSDRRK